MNTKKKLIPRLLIDPSFQSLEKNAHRTSYKRYFCPTLTIKDYNIMVDG